MSSSQPLASSAPSSSTPLWNLDFSLRAESGYLFGSEKQGHSGFLGRAQLELKDEFVDGFPAFWSLGVGVGSMSLSTTQSFATAGQWTSQIKPTLQYSGEGMVGFYPTGQRPFSVSVGFRYFFQELLTPGTNLNEYCNNGVCEPVGTSGIMVPGGGARDAKGGAVSGYAIPVRLALDFQPDDASWPLIQAAVAYALAQMKVDPNVEPTFEFGGHEVMFSLAVNLSSSPARHPVEEPASPEPLPPYKHHAAPFVADEAPPPQPKKKPVVQAKITPPVDYQALLDKAIRLIDEGKLNDAKRILQGILRKNAGQFLAHYYLAVVFKKQGYLQRALTHIDHALQLKNDDPKVYLLAGNIYLKQENYKDAITAFARVTQLRPDSYDAYSTLNLVYQKQEQPKKAEAVLKAFLKRQPKHGVAAYTLGFLLYRHARVEEAIPYLKIAAATPSNVQKRCQALLDELTGDKQKLFDEAMELVMAGRLMDARRKLLDLTRQYPSFTAAHFQLGSVYLELGSTIKAEHHLRQVVKHDPQDDLAQMQLGIVLARNQKYKEAIPILTIALKLHPKDSAVYYHLGLAYEHKGDYVRAEKYWRMGLKMQHDNPLFYERLARLLLKQDKLQEARTILEKGVQQYPEHAALRSLMY